MAIPIKSDLIEQFYWEAGRWATLAIDPDRTDTGAYSETSTTSGVTYSGTDGTDGLLDQLATALDDYNIRASDWNAIASEINNIINNEISPLKQEILEIKSKLEQEGIIDFANETGYGAFFTFEDTDGINIGSTTATINTVGKQVEFDDTGSKVLVLNNRTLSNEFTEVALRLYPNGGVIQGESDGDFTNVSTIDLLSPGFTLTTNEKLWINATEVDITGVAGGSTIIDRTTPVQVVNQAYSTQGNGGRKQVVLDNGNIICLLKDGNSIKMLKSTDSGANWTQQGSSIGFTSVEGFAISTDGTQLYTVFSANNSRSYYRVYDEFGNKLQDANETQTAMGDCSIVISDDNTKITACWSSKNSTYPNSFNIRAIQGIISAGVVTWGSVEQITANGTASNDSTSPSVIYKNDGYPIISYATQATSNYFVRVENYNGTSWDTYTIYTAGAYTQSNPSIDKLSTGELIVVWHGSDSISSTSNVRFAQSTDATGTSWNDEKVTTYASGGVVDGSITRNNSDKIFIVIRYFSSPNYFMRLIEGSVGSWSESNIATSTSVLDNPNTANNFRSFEKPLTIYQDGEDSDVKFYGKLIIGGAFTLTLGSNVTLTDGQQIPITGVLTSTANTQTMNISDVTSEYYYYDRAVTSSDTLALQTTGKSVNLDILTYSLG